MNPFAQKAPSVDATFEGLSALYPKAYHPREVDPYTKCRIILMNGTEFESVKFSHQMARHCENPEIRRELAMSRRTEQQQQKKLACLKPIEETVLEHTISYEQLAVDLTAHLAKRVSSGNVRQALDLALLEDFDHLYRYADLREMDDGEHAERLVGRYTEIMPGRPTISEHRFPADGIPCALGKDAPLFDKLAAMIITAAEQQTMNYYMNIGCFYDSDLGRRLYQEIAMIEEQHVTQYGALLDTSCTWLENLLMHEYTECYLYWSCVEDETDPAVKRIWEQHFEQEVSHLHTAEELLKTYEGKEACQVIPEGTFPELLRFGPQKAYVRKVIKNTVTNTAMGEDPAVPVDTLPKDNTFHAYQQAVCPDAARVASHQVISETIGNNGKDYRFEEKPHPVEALRDRTVDNITIAR
ncbi:hypothetical protein MSS88_03610 [bacterium]|nr:hypothetical protein [bacterium]